MKTSNLKKWVTAFYYKKYFYDEKVKEFRKNWTRSGRQKTLTSLKELIAVTEKVEKELKRLKL